MRACQRTWCFFLGLGRLGVSLAGYWTTKGCYVGHDCSQIAEIISLAVLTREFDDDDAKKADGISKAMISGDLLNTIRLSYTTHQQKILSMTPHAASNVRVDPLGAKNSMEWPATWWACSGFNVSKEPGSPAPSTPHVSLKCTVSGLPSPILSETSIGLIGSLSGLWELWLPELHLIIRRSHRVSAPYSMMQAFVHCGLGSKKAGKCCISDNGGVWRPPIASAA